MMDDNYGVVQGTPDCIGGFDISCHVPVIAFEAAREGFNVSITTAAGGAMPTVARIASIKGEATR